MDAAINSETSVPEYLSMPVLRFYETWQAICAIYERRAEAANARRNTSGAPRPKRAKRKRKK